MRTRDVKVQEKVDAAKLLCSTVHRDVRGVALGYARVA
jgi:hypothetical protein